MPMDKSDEFWMEKALGKAEEAALLGEVPVGSVIVDASGKLLAAAANRTISDNDPTAHAEILAIRLAAQVVGNYRLTGTTVYSTLEPCAMCAGALVTARVSRLVYGAADERFGAVETKFRICDSPDLNHRLSITAGILADSCRKLMQDFFRVRR